LSLDILARYAFRNDHFFDSQISNAAPLTAPHAKEHVSGGDIKLTWRGDHNLAVGGVDYEHFEWSSNDNFSGIQADTLRQTVDRWGVYLNDTLSLGPLALIPGGRFDHTQSAGDQFSPSFGVTYQVGENTVVRGYTARGFSLPVLTLDRGSEKVWTSQIGVESSALPYLWLKGTLFRIQTWHFLALDNQSGLFHPEEHIALGTELEIRTTPVWNTSLGAGYTFTDTTRTSNGSQVYGVPRHTVQTKLLYDDKTFRGVLTGRHIWWNQDPSYGARYFGLLWDLHLGATLYKHENNSLEVFFSGHNLFNGAQSPDTVFQPNTPRWFEGGLKVRF
jgi:vitamin B12 transporter